jgi:hypothetical protein
MGYNTSFTGEFQIHPKLSEEKVDEISNFIESNHGYDKYSGIGTRWCNWEIINEFFGDEFTVLRWNESEKSYNMFEWLKVIQEKFLKDHTITGEVEASGEEFLDYWKMIADGKTVKKMKIKSIEWETDE